MIYDKKNSKELINFEFFYQKELIFWDFQSITLTSKSFGIVRKTINMQKKYQAFLISVIAYGGMFFLRDCITSSSAHLSKLGYFTGEHYSIYVACNYGNLRIIYKQQTV